MGVMSKRPNEFNSIACIPVSSIKAPENEQPPADEVKECHGDDDRGDDEHDRPERIHRSIAGIFPLMRNLCPRKSDCSGETLVAGVDRRRSLALKLK